MRLLSVAKSPTDATMTPCPWSGDATQPGFVFPELSDGEFGIPNLQAKGSFGIGVSGGGLRATSLAIGWLRGMQRLGLLRKARYLGSASGARPVPAAPQRWMACHGRCAQVGLLLR